MWKILQVRLNQRLELQSLRFSLIEGRVGLVWHLTGRHMLSRWVKVKVLVIEEDVSTECLKYLGLLKSAQEEDLIYVDTPVPKCLDDAQLGWGIPSCDDREVNRRELDAEGKAALQFCQLVKKLRIRTFRHGRILVGIFILVKTAEPLRLVDDLAAVIEENGISIKGDANLALRN